MVNNQSRGTIAYCSREDHVSPLFATSLARLAAHHPTAKVVHCIGSNIAEQRNTAVLEMEGDWLFFLDSDQIAAPDTIDRLLAYNADVVQGLCLARHPPHEPILYSIDGKQRMKIPTGQPRLIPVSLVGAGGTLYHRHVFEELASPWFTGIIGTEDIGLARKASMAGMKLAVDTSTPIGHITPVAIWPNYTDGEWAIRYQLANDGWFIVPFPSL